MFLLHYKCFTMESMLSPINQNHINKQQYADVQQATFSNSNLNSNIKMKPELNNDIVELSSKKRQCKKGVLIASGLVATAGLILGAIKFNKINTVKKEITQIYDNVFETISKETKDKLGFDFIKPKIKFKRLQGAQGNYIPGQNTIEINLNALNRKNLIRYVADEVSYSNLDGLKIFDKYVYHKGKMPKGMRCLTSEELFLANMTTLRHELTHARQDQILASTKGGVEKLFELLKKDKSDLTFDDFLNAHSLYKNLNSQKKFNLNDEITVSCGKRKIAYKVENIVNSLAGYSSSNSEEYFSNLLEFEARVEEMRALNVVEKTFSKQNIDKESLKYFRSVTAQNLENIYQHVTQ